MAQELFTLANLGTTAGATAATVVVSNTVQSVVNRSPKWLALVVAQVLVLSVTVFAGTVLVSDYFLAMLNGCLVYCSAVGINTMTSPPAQPGGQAIPRSATEAGLPQHERASVAHRKRTFSSRWW